eukprot:364228-Chlamydomonas_euryale.AAC.9
MHVGSIAMHLRPMGARTSCEHGEGADSLDRAVRTERWLPRSHGTVAWAGLVSTHRKNLDCRSTCVASNCPVAAHVSPNCTAPLRVPHRTEPQLTHAVRCCALRCCCAGCVCAAEPGRWVASLLTLVGVSCLHSWPPSEGRTFFQPAGRPASQPAREIKWEWPALLYSQMPTHLHVAKQFQLSNSPVGIDPGLAIPTFVRCPQCCATCMLRRFNPLHLPASVVFGRGRAAFPCPD